jgi:hypothetical protein
MSFNMIGGAVLILAGFFGAANSCFVREEPNLLISLLSGLSVSIGFVWLAVEAGRHGYHRRPQGSPPGDMDPAKATDPMK